MTYSEVFTAVVSALCVFLSVPTSATAQTYSTFVAPNGLYTQPNAINAIGQIVGFYWDSKSISHGFVREATGTVATFDPKGSMGTNPVAIDASGTIVGDYVASDSPGHGFLRRSNGKIISFDPPKSLYTLVAGTDGNIVGSYEPGKGVVGYLRTKKGIYLTFKYAGRATEPHGTNKAGAVVGIYRSKDGTTTHGFLRHSDGTFEEIRSHGTTWPVAINESGTIVGGDAHESVFVQTADGSITTLSVPGADTTIVAGINSKGTVVGSAHFESTGDHGFMWSAERGLVSIDVPGATYTIPSGINDDDVVIGTCDFIDGEKESSAAFVRTP